MSKLAAKIRDNPLLHEFMSAIEYIHAHKITDEALDVMAIQWFEKILASAIKQNSIEVPFGKPIGKVKEYYGPGELSETFDKIAGVMLLKGYEKPSNLPK